MDGISSPCAHMLLADLISGFSKEERGAWKAALYYAGKPIALSGRDVTESRSRAIRS